ncbi:MAG: hypothetical protein MUE61_15085 [Vicinamibacterales bacterium]|jgi:hypothetical protein|nr:hypothetical protein [Vicinamibacterales bacterium]
MMIEDWLAGACADAERRGLADLKPLLESLADATRALRAAGWEDTSGTPAAPPPAGTVAPPADGAPQ